MSAKEIITLNTNEDGNVDAEKTIAALTTKIKSYQEKGLTLTGNEQLRLIEEDLSFVFSFLYDGILSALAELEIHANTLSSMMDGKVRKVEAFDFEGRTAAAAALLRMNQLAGIHDILEAKDVEEV